uniref:Protein kinase domain-containing protein n=1 Tax=Panagrellus redivivus TaxID=6233 RepID=A0A7E4UN53_PANRE
MQFPSGPTNPPINHDADRRLLRTRMRFIDSRGDGRLPSFPTNIHGLVLIILMRGINCEVLKISKNVSPLIRIGDQWRFKHEKNDIGDCTDIAFKIPNSDLKLLGTGYTKTVYQLPDGRAIKRIAFFGPSITDCLDNEDQSDYNEEVCLQTVAKSFITEIDNLLLLQNDSNIPRLHSYCIPYNFITDAPDIGIIIDGGHPLDAILLAQINWHSRVEMLNEILAFLKRHERLSFRDIRRQQFVMIDNHPFLVDLDDVGTTSSDATDLMNRLYSGFIDGFFFHNQPTSAAIILLQLRESYKNSSLNFEVLSRLTRDLTNF